MPFLVGAAGGVILTDGQTSQGLLRALREDIAELRRELHDKADRSQLEALERTVVGANGNRGLVAEVAIVAAKVGDLDKTVGRLVAASWGIVGAVIIAIIVTAVRGGP